jgi:phage gp36-like protein
MAHTLATAYLTLPDMVALLPQMIAVEAFDDDKDGIPDEAVVEAVVILASNKVDSYLENRYLTPIPIATAPATVVAAAVHFAISILYGRRGLADQNPWKDECIQLRKMLEAVREYRMDLDLTSRTPEGQDPIEDLTEPAIAVGSNRLTF